MGEPLREELPEKDAQPDALTERRALRVELLEPDCERLPEPHAEADGDALPTGDALGLCVLEPLRLGVAVADAHAEPLRERDGLAVPLSLLLVLPLRAGERLLLAQRDAVEQMEEEREKAGEDDAREAEALPVGRRDALPDALALAQ